MYCYIMQNSFQYFQWCKIVQWEEHGGTLFLLCVLQIDCKRLPAKPNVAWTVGIQWFSFDVNTMIITIPTKWDEHPHKRNVPHPYNRLPVARWVERKEHFTTLRVVHCAQEMAMQLQNMEIDVRLVIIQGLLAGNALELCGWPNLRPFRLVFVMSWCSFLCMPAKAGNSVQTRHRCLVDCIGDAANSSTCFGEMKQWPSQT